MNSYTLKGVVVINYRLRLKTGLHVGGAKETFEIGGVDNPVIKLSNRVFVKGGDGREVEIPKDAPYIPGSSLKGKVRSLMEWFIREPKGLNGGEKTSVEYMTEKAQSDRRKLGAPCDCGTCSICKLFGVSDVRTLKSFIDSGNVERLPGPPRAEFSDAYPTPESLELLEQSLGEGLYTEIKYENRINRITGAVEHGGLRNQERVPAGVEFEGEITLDVYSEDDAQLLGKLLTGLRLLESSYLGGSGSRGYGRVEFSKLSITFRGRDYFEKGEGETPLVEGKPLSQIKTEKVISRLKDTLKGSN